MSRFQQAIYCKVLKEPLRRYLLKKKEKSLWKPKQFRLRLSELLVLLYLLFAFLVFIGAIFLIKPQKQSCLFAVFMLIYWIIAIGVPLNISENKRDKAKKNKYPISLLEFITKSKRLMDTSNVYIRAIRHVLGHIYSSNSCQIYPTDTHEKLAYLTRTAKSPFAFELILGVAHRLSIQLNDEDVDQITENICNCPDVETLIVKLSRELEQRRGRNCQNAIDIKFLFSEEKKKVWKCVFGGLLLSTLFSLRICVEERDFTSTSIISQILIITAIGGLFGWGYAALINRKPKRDSEDDRKLWDMVSALGTYGEAARYLYFLLNSMSIGESVTIRESEPLPEYEVEGLERLPCFSEICAYLKSAIDVEDRFYEQPIEGELISRLKDEQPENKQYNHTVTICDGIEDAYITFYRNPIE